MIFPSSSYVLLFNQSMQPFLMRRSDQMLWHVRTYIYLFATYLYKVKWINLYSVLFNFHRAINNAKNHEATFRLV